MAIEFNVDIKDGVSAPAEKAARSLQGLKSQFKDLDRVSKTVAKSGVPAHLQSIETWARKVTPLLNRKDFKSLLPKPREAKSTAQELDGLIGSFKQLGQVKGLDNLKSVLSGVVGVIQRIGQAAALAVASIVALGVAMAAAVTAAVLKGWQTASGIIGQFNALKKGSGRNALKDILDVQRATGGDLEESRKAYGTLIASGANRQMAKDLAKIRADFVALGEEGEAAAGKLTDVLVESTVSDSAFEDIAKNLGENGRKALGKALGITDKALERTTKGGELLKKELEKLDPKKFLETVIKIRKAQGELGAGAKASTPVFTRLSRAIQSFFVDVGKDTKLGEFIMPVVKAIEDFAKDEKNVAAVASAVNLIASTIEKLYGAVKVDPKRIQGGFLAFIEGFKEGITEFAAGLSGLTGGEEDPKKTAEALRNLGKALGMITVAVIATGLGVAYLANNLGTFSAWAATVAAWFPTLVDVITNPLRAATTLILAFALAGLASLTVGWANVINTVIAGLNRILAAAKQIPGLGSVVGGIQPIQPIAAPSIAPTKPGAGTTNNQRTTNQTFNVQAQALNPAELANQLKSMLGGLVPSGEAG